jgi:hypothetical protein
MGFSVFGVVGGILLLFAGLAVATDGGKQWRP